MPQQLAIARVGGIVGRKDRAEIGNRVGRIVAAADRIAALLHRREIDGDRFGGPQAERSTATPIFGLVGILRADARHGIDIVNKRRILPPEAADADRDLVTDDRDVDRAAGRIALATVGDMVGADFDAA